MLPIGAATRAALDGKQDVGAVVPPSEPAPITESAVTQTGGKTASVWSDTQRTTITMDPDAMQGGNEVTFTFSNPLFTNAKHPQISIIGGTFNLFAAQCRIVPLGGAADVSIRNMGTQTMGEAVVLRITIT